VADDIEVTPGTGPAVATDEVGSRHFQVIKLDLGGNGLSVPVVDELPVSIASSPLPTGAATEATLATIETDLDTVITGLTSINSGVDGLEGLIGSTNTKLDTVIGHVDGVETAIAATNTKLDTVNTNLGTIDGHVDGLETAVASTNTKLDTIHADVDGVEALLTTIDGHVDGLETSVDGLETLVGTTNSTLTTIDGRVDGLETLIGTTNSTLTTIDGRVDGVETLLTAIDGHVDGLEASNSAIQTAVEIMDDWDESDRAKVNNIVGQAGVDGNSGNVSAKTQRVVLANDVALPAGTNAIGKLAANNGVDIGDVDVASVVPGTGATNLGKAEDAGHNTGDVGVMALGVRAAAPTERSAGPTDGDYEPFATNEVGAMWTSEAGSANGGASTMNATSGDGSTALTNSAQVIKGSPGKLYGYYIFNPNTVTEYVIFYNVAAASVTVGTTNPLFLLAIPAGSAANLFGTPGIGFDTAMSWAASSAAATSGAPTTALDAVAWYK